MRFSPAFVIAASAFLAGCPNTDPAVFVTASIDGAEATVVSSVFGSGLQDGAFHLKLHLGARASGPSQVSLGSFAILDAGKKSAIVASLPVDASPTNFPVTVEPDSDVDVDFKFDTGTATKLTADDKIKLCDPAGVVIRGAIEDSLEDGATTVYSTPFHLAGCD